jgi:hypothetical protein
MYSCKTDRKITRSNESVDIPVIANAIFLTLDAGNHQRNRLRRRMIVGNAR